MPEDNVSRQEARVPASGGRALDPAEVMVYLNVLDRFETPAYERAWRFFRETTDKCPDYESFQARCPLWSAARGGRMGSRRALGRGSA
jgi:hypothetical protein